MSQRSLLLRVLTGASLVAALAVPIGVGSLSSASAAKVYEGPDVASYQHPHPTRAHPHGQPINWNKVRKTGKQFAIVKATEGLTYISPDFAGPYFSDYADAAAAGLVHGSYHFARPALPVASSAVAQAKFFARTIGAVKTPATLPPALDLEVTGGLTPPQLVTWAQDFLLEMRTLTGRTPMLYTYPSFWTNDLGDPKALARYPLWMAAYGASRAPVSDLWQYTSTAHVKGIVGGVDVSRFVGTSGFPWSTLSDGTVKTPWKAAAPRPPVSPKASVDGSSVTVTWRPGDAGTSPVRSYQVTASPDGAVETVSGSSCSATFADLSARRSYTFTVTGVNHIGTSPLSAPTNAVTPTVPTLLATILPVSLSYGSTLPITATLTRTDTKKGLAGRRLLIFRRTSIRASWHQVRKLTTNASGRVSTTLRPHRSAQLELVFPGTLGVARSTRFVNYVVRPTLTAALSAPTVAHGGHVQLTGSATPFELGQHVVLEGRDNGRWLPLATTKIRRTGQFSFRIHPKTKTLDVLRVDVAATSLRGSAHSARVKLTVT